jgi:hypothetical protein
MINPEIQTLHDPDGTPVTNVTFDLSHQQLSAAGYAVGEIIVERHRGHAHETDDVLALRELTGLRDELDRMAESSANATVLMTLGRMIAFHDAMDQWVTSRTSRSWGREADRDALPVVGAMLHPLADLREQAVTAALGSAQPR